MAVGAGSAEELKCLSHVEGVEDGGGELDVPKVTRAVEGGETASGAAVCEGKVSACSRG